MINIHAIQDIFKWLQWKIRSTNRIQFLYWIESNIVWFNSKCDRKTANDQMIIASNDTWDYIEYSIFMEIVCFSSCCWCLFFFFRCCCFCWLRSSILCLRCSCLSFRAMNIWNSHQKPDCNQFRFKCLRKIELKRKKKWSRIK